jgi:ribosomal protein L34E
MYAEQMRKCTGCNKPKRESAFYNYTHEHRCKSCISRIRKDKYAQDPIGNAAKKRAYTLINPDKVKSIKLKQTYGITLDEYNVKLAEQDGKCAICNRPETAVWRGRVLRLAVDHRKTPHQVRGLLCMKCNRALGLLEENLESIRAMIDYVLKYLK